MFLRRLHTKKKGVHGNNVTNINEFIDEIKFILENGEMVTFVVNKIKGQQRDM